MHLNEMNKELPQLIAEVFVYSKPKSKVDEENKQAFRLTY